MRCDIIIKWKVTGSSQTFQDKLICFFSFSLHSSNCSWVSVKLPERNLHLSLLSFCHLSLSPPYFQASLVFFSFSVLPGLCSMAQFFLPETPKHSSSFCLLPFSVLGFPLSLTLSTLPPSACVKLFRFYFRSSHLPPLDSKESHLKWSCVLFVVFLWEHLKKIFSF